SNPSTPSAARAAGALPIRASRITRWLFAWWRNGWPRRRRTQTVKNLGTSDNPRRARLTTVSFVLVWSFSLAVAGHTQAADQQSNPPPVRQHTERSFQQLQQH